MAPHALEPWTNGYGSTSHGRVDTVPDYPSETKRYPESGVSVLIVGAGIGGLMSAMECWRKGHTVRIIERSDGPVFTGDTINIQASAMSIFRHWPEFARDLEAAQYDCWMTYNKHTGEHIYGPNPPSFNDPENMIGRVGPHVAFMQHRVKLHKLFLAQVEKLGLKVEWNKKVIEYFEDEDIEKGGIVVEGGQRYYADVVIAADGIKTKSGIIVAGRHTPAFPSGMAIYRCAYPAKQALADPTVRERWERPEGSRPTWDFWLGSGVHSAVLMSKDLASWGLTHQDDGSAKESWDPHVTPDEVVKAMEKEAPGWHKAIPALIKTAPEGSIIHWKLMWRDLNPEWTSPGGRIAQVGDSAHTFLPASGNGATQAMEDAITLATCLQLAGKSNAAYATKVFNRLRFERVSCAQKMSFVNSQIKHKTDWDAIARDPKRIRTRFPRWIYQHNPEDYAYQKFGLAFNNVVSGAPFKNTNYPPGHKFKPWTIDEVKQDIKDGKNIEAFLDGDWS
ncbi:hypothetical protein ACLMJK_005223 [Lecanora helva]